MCRATDLGDDKAKMVVRSQDGQLFTDAIGVGLMAIMSTQPIIDMINTSTGWNMDLDAMLKAGERIFQLMRAMTCKLGVTPGDDNLPAIVLRPIPDSGQQGHVPNMEKMLPEYYQIRVSE